MASLLLASAALAGTLAIVPHDVTPERAEVLRAVLAADGDDVTLVPARELLDVANVVTVDGLPDAEECDRRVPIEDWRGRFDAARRKLQLLAFADGLAELVALDVELTCLATPPATSDLFRLELAVAEAHTFLAQSAGRDAGKRRFHEDEAHAALVRAAAFGASLSVPPDVPPEVLAAYTKVRRREGDDPPRVVVAGPGARVGARFNGRPLPDGAFEAVRGTNLVQAADGAEVTAAARVPLRAGQTALIWLAPEGEPPLEAALADALAALGEGRRLSDVEEGLLAGAARLLGPDAVYVVDDGRALWVFEPDEGVLRAASPLPLPARPVDAWRAVIGAGPSAGWTNLGAGPLDGLGGPHAGVAVYGRVAINRWLAASATVDPWAVASPIPDAQGGGTLFRATIPATVGVRFGPHTRKLAVEGGVDVGLHAFGTFDDAPRMSFYAAAAGGVSGALGPRVALRLQGWFGAGLGYVGGGGTLGLEGRL